MHPPRNHRLQLMLQYLKNKQMRKNESQGYRSLEFGLISLIIIDIQKIICHFKKKGDPEF